MRKDPAPVTEFDPFDDEVLTNPFPHLARLRSMAAVVWLTVYDVFAVTRHSEVEQALRDWQTYGSGAGVGLADFRKEPPWRPPSLLLETDPPAHTRNRGVLSRALTPKVLASLKQAFVEHAEKIAEEVVSRGRFDAVQDVAQAYPLQVFPDALGLGPERRADLLRYGDLAFNAFGPRNVLTQRALEGAGDLQAWIASQCQREAISPDGIGSIIYAAADAGDVTEHEAALLLRSLLTAGVDTTVSGLAAALLHLTSSEDQWQLLHADPSLARNAFEEAVRLESPVQTFFRTTTCDTELGGCPIPAGQKVLLLLASANRDPERWADPDRYDITRRAAGHVGFGSGIHGCVGQMIARMEGDAMLSALARRIRRFSSVGTPERRLNNTLRSIISLPVEVEAA